MVCVVRGGRERRVIVWCVAGLFGLQDGFSQGLALAGCTLFIPVPLAFVYAMEALTGLWTLYIHSDTSPLPWPLMGSDYHYIHHRYNWRAHRSKWHAS